MFAYIMMSRICFVCVFKFFGVLLWIVMSLNQPIQR